MNVYIKLPTILIDEQYDEEDARNADLMGMEYRPEAIEIESYEYILISGTSQIKSFYSDTEDRVSAVTTHFDVIQYNIGLEDFLEKMRGHITVIE